MLERDILFFVETEMNRWEEQSKWRSRIEINQSDSHKREHTSTFHIPSRSM